MLQPTRDAALKALHGFLPRAGETYARLRNFDPGPGAPSAVSGLSPWIRIRLLTEWEVALAAQEKHGVEAAGKFIDEVCWRSYFKGWLQLRPSVWREYVLALRRLEPSPLCQQVLEARSGIDCLDAWVRELRETHTLHNHARMWFAAIWVHTLGLPWELGAQFFLQELLDGDPASNTLSWRWVAGLHTPGKCYAARAENIRKYTEGRFQANLPPAPPPKAPSVQLPPPGKIVKLLDLPEKRQIGILLTEEDLAAGDWLGRERGLPVVAGYFPKAAYAQHEISAAVQVFRREALLGVLPEDAPLLETPEALLSWAAGCGWEGLAVSEPMTGFHEPLLNLEWPIPVFPVRSLWDDTLFPSAGGGFFRFRQAIPRALKKVASGSSMPGAC